MILITRATGNIGAQLVRKLSGSRHPIRAFVRSRAQARAIALPGIELVEGDFAKPETFQRALARVDSLFLLIPSSSEVEQQQCNFVDAAKRRKVRHIVKLSQLGADEFAPGRFRRYHGTVENYIMKSGIEYTFLRPNLFMQGLLNFRATIYSQGTFYAPAGNAKVSVVDTRDIASIAARVLTEPWHYGKTYDITGSESLTHAAMADQLSHALRRQILYVDVPPQAMQETLLSYGTPAWQVEGLVEDYEHYRSGEAAMVTPTVRDLTGKEAISFFRFAHDYAGSFLGKAASAA